MVTSDRRRHLAVVPDLEAEAEVDVVEAEVVLPPGPGPGVDSGLGMEPIPYSTALHIVEEE